MGLDMDTNAMPAQSGTYAVKDKPVLRNVEYVKETGQFVVKDSGKREQFESGMVRDTTEGKVDYTLVLDGPLFQRLAEHLMKGAKKYNKRNWMKACGEAELARFKESAFRHFLQWYRGDTDEDHFSATVFNLNGYEYVKEKQNAEALQESKAY